MKKIVFSLILFGLTSQGFSQIIKTEQLSEVVVTAVNYKYLNAITNEEEALPVQMLERKAAAYNIKESELYSDEYEFYTVSFFIPNGKIVAVYNADGQIIRTIEKFKDIKLPETVAKAVVDRFPKWEVDNKTYKLKLKNGDERMKVKIDETGTFQ
jgi:hypothetical protein